MDIIGPRRPLSRETRLLLVTILVSITTLWLLARIRFADEPVTPISPVLNQLVPSPVFDQLSSAMFQIQGRLAPVLMGLEINRASVSGTSHLETVPALRLDAETAVAMVDGLSMMEQTDLTLGAGIIARDPASGLTVFRVPSGDTLSEPVSALAVWSPRQPLAPRYLIAGDVSRGVVSGRPLLIGPLEALTSHVWLEPVWELRSGTNVEPGTFVFSTDGALAGLVDRVGEALVLVPGEAVVRAAEELRQRGDQEYGELGITVQPLTPDVAASTRVQAGVIVTSVDPQGPAAGQLEVIDVIVGVGDEPLSTYEHWQAVAGRVVAGQTIVLRVQRGAENLTVTLTGAAPPSPVDRQTLGLTLRSVPRVGVEVVAVTPGSAAAAAGIGPGDVITVFGDRRAPSQAEVRDRFAAAPVDRPLLVAVTRGTAHHVLTIDKR